MPNIAYHLYSFLAVGPISPSAPVVVAGHITDQSATSSHRHNPTKLLFQNYYIPRLSILDGFQKNIKYIDTKTNGTLRLPSIANLM